MRIRPARADDIGALTTMRMLLWPDEGAEDEHRRELEEILIEEKQPGVYPLATFVAELDDGSLAGFIEVGMRSYADGCDPARPVGYLEGWFVCEEQRRRGIGAALVRAAEDWSRAQGCTEMASDTWQDNDVSERAHASLGYEVVDRVVTFRKPL